MRFRIISNSVRYQLQRKFLFWPFWITQRHGYGQDAYFQTHQEAMNHKNFLIRLKRSYAGPWKEVQELENEKD